MNLRQIFIPILLLVFITSDALYAQSPKPMVAYRIGIDWHFYNTNNELMFPVNKIIAPPMVTAYFHGWCKVSLPDAIDGKIVIREGVINEKGIEVALDEMPDKYRIVGIDKEQGKNIISISNWLAMGAINSEGKRVPSKPLFHWQRLGNGWGAGYGTFSSDDPEIQSEEEFPSAGEAEMEYEVWDINNAKMVFKLKAEEIGGYGDGYITAKKDGLWGIVDKSGKWVVAPKFKNIGSLSLEDVEYFDEYTDLLRDFKQGAIPAQNTDGKWGLINTKGTWLLAAEYSAAFYAGDLNWFFSNTDERYVLSNAKGKLWKDLEVETPIKVYNGLIFTYKEEQDWHLRNSAGKIFCFSADMPTYMGDGYYITTTEGGPPSLVGPNGKALKSYEDIRFENIGFFIYDLAPVKVGEELGYLNKKGEWAIPLGKIPFKGGDLPEAMDGFIHVWTGENHVFYNGKGEVIRTDEKDGKWQMMVVLLDGNLGLWVSY